MQNVRTQRANLLSKELKGETREGKRNQRGKGNFCNESYDFSILSRGNPVFSQSRRFSNLPFLFPYFYRRRTETRFFFISISLHFLSFP